MDDYVCELDIILAFVRCKVLENVGKVFSV